MIGLERSPGIGCRRPGYAHPAQQPIHHLLRCHRNSGGAMFLAGILPGLVLILILYAVVLMMREGRIRSKRRYTWRERARILFEVLPFFGVPVAILGGIYGGIATPVEAGGRGLRLCGTHRTFCVPPTDLQSDCEFPANLRPDHQA